MPNTTFPNGVSAGDTDQTSTVLWAHSKNPGRVTFAVSTSSDFSDLSQIVSTSTAQVIDSAVPVKVEISALTPGTHYHYQVMHANRTSETGQFETAAAAGTHAGFHFGVSGDWRGELAPYPAISNADDRGLDLFVKLGDTIYADVLSPAVPRTDAVTLGQFRAKHDEVYSTVSGLNAWADLQRTTSIMATIDDHEVRNDFAGGASPASDPRFAGSKGAFINDTTLYERGLLAFQEYNAVRNEFYDTTTNDLRFHEEHKLYRVSTYGDDAAVFLLDGRSFRDTELTPVNPAKLGDITRFQGESFNPYRTLLGHTQLDELKQDLTKAEQAGVTWKFIMNPEPIQNLGALAAQDRYEGYAAERTELLRFIHDSGIDNVVFVSADLHGTVVNNLTYQERFGGPQIATNAFEIVTGAVAYDPPLGPTVAGLAGLTQQQLAFYNSLPISNDPGDSIPPALPNDKDDFVKAVGNSAINLLDAGHDPLGLNANLPEAEGLIDANLIQGDYVAAHEYGWTEFEINPESQQLLVTTWGVDAYNSDELEKNPQNVATLTPEIYSQFSVNPHWDFMV